MKLIKFTLFACSCIGLYIFRAEWLYLLDPRIIGGLIIIGVLSMLLTLLFYVALVMGGVVAGYKK